MSTFSNTKQLHSLPVIQVGHCCMKWQLSFKVVASQLVPTKSNSTEISLTNSNFGSKFPVLLQLW